MFASKRKKKKKREKEKQVTKFYDISTVKTKISRNLIFETLKFKNLGPFFDFGKLRARKTNFFL